MFSVAGYVLGELGDDQAPEAVALPIALVVDALELVVVPIEQPVQRRFPRLARAVDPDTHGNRAPHGRDSPAGAVTGAVWHSASARLAIDGGLTCR